MTGLQAEKTEETTVEPPKLPAEIKFEKDGRVAIITIDRPEAMNSLTADMLIGIEDAMKAFDDDPDLWAAVFTASGDKAFSSGLDLKEAAPMLTGGDQLGFDDWTKRQFSDVFKPIICAVNGFCIAGGMEMMLGTDLRMPVRRRNKEFAVTVGIHVEISGQEGRPLVHELFEYLPVLREAAGVVGLGERVLGVGHDDRQRCSVQGSCHTRDARVASDGGARLRMSRGLIAIDA